MQRGPGGLQSRQNIYKIFGKISFKNRNRPIYDTY